MPDNGCEQQLKLVLSGYEVVRSQFFGSSAIISVTFSHGKIRFSSTCIRNFGDCEYVELQIHPENKLLAVRASAIENRNAVKWGVRKSKKLFVCEISGSVFNATLYELFEWIPALCYRLRGEIRRVGNESYAIFDACENEIVMSVGVARPQVPIDEKVYAQLSEDEKTKIRQKQHQRELRVQVKDAEKATLFDEVANGSIYVSAQTKYRTVALPSFWRGSFGNAYNEQQHINSSFENKTRTYDNTLEIQPTAPEILNEQIKGLLQRINDNDASDINSSFSHIP